jgi:Signal transduction histidine kinase
VRVSKKGILKIIVSDTGCGIEKDALDRLFEKFSQFNNEQIKRQCGSGLGLYITKHIIDKMNGRIEAFSKLGMGTTFIIGIPTYSPSSFMPEYAEKEIVNQLIPRELKVIVVDDTDFNISLLQSYLDKINAKIIFAAKNGAETYRHCASCLESNIRVDLLISDIDMPIMDGKALCRKIRKHEAEHKLSRMPIIIISGNDSIVDINKLLDTNGECQADYFVKKPLTCSDLLLVIGKCVLQKS